MNHDDSDKRFYVYVHKDEHGNIRYVGHGSGRRYKSKTQRTKEHLDIIDNLTKEIVKDGLSKDNAIDLELKIYEDNLSAGILLNKSKPVKIHKLSYGYVSQYLEYDENSSTFLRWKKCSKYKNELVGKDAGTFDKSRGYSAVKLDGVAFRSHRIIFVLNTKQDLDSNKFIDHIDGNPSNNAFDNLRLVNARDNSLNKKKNINNNSGVKGIFFDNKSNAWRAVWSHNLIQIRKGFSITKLLKDNPGMTVEQASKIAFDMACEARKIVEQELYIIESRDST